MQGRCSSAASAHTPRRAKARLSTRWSIPGTCTSSTPKRASASMARMRKWRRAASTADAGSCRWLERLETLQVDAVDPVRRDDDYHHGVTTAAPDDGSRPAQIDGELTHQAVPSTTRARTDRSRHLCTEDR